MLAAYLCTAIKYPTGTRDVALIMPTPSIVRKLEERINRYPTEWHVELASERRQNTMAHDDLTQTIEELLRKQPRHTTKHL